jgi:hypothetical protein
VVNTTAAEKFCAGVFKLRANLATASEHDRLTAKRSDTRARIETLQSAGANTDSDPQSTVIAALFNVDKSTPRLVLTTALAVVLELGSVILILLIAGPALLGWQNHHNRAPDASQKPKLVPPKIVNPVTIPVRSRHPLNLLGLQLRRNKPSLAADRGDDHAR